MIAKTITIILSTIVKRALWHSCVLCGLLYMPAANATTVNLQQVLQSVIDNYPSIQTALLQVERAKRGIAKTQSQLGWQLQGQAGIQRDVSLFGTASDVISADGSWQRQLESGANLGVDANISRTDNENSLPGVANPTTSTSLDLKYRHPLAKGADNPSYAEATLQARLDTSLAYAEKKALYDQLAEQVIDIYFAIASIQNQQANIEQTIARSQRRQNYLKNRSDLGVAEKTDLLQVDAQLKSQQAELKAIRLSLQSQRIRLNRLMGRDAYDELVLSTSEPLIGLTQAKPDAELIEQQAIAHNAQLVSIDNRIQLADSAIRLRRNEQQDALDLVMFIGSRTQNGDSSGGSSGNQSEVVGGISVELQQDYDKSAVDAEIEQAMFDKDIAMVEKKQLLEDIHYDVAVLLSEIETGKKAIAAYSDSVRSEQSKLKEAEQRYRKGRSDTDQLLSFESQLSAAELAGENQKLELLKDLYALQLLRGSLWQGIRLPEDEVTH